MVLSEANLDRLSGLVLRDLSLGKDDVNDLCFKIEKAWWYYLDHRRGDSWTDDGWIYFDQFMKELVAHVRELTVYSDRVESIISAWRWHKHTIPRYGCIIIDPSYKKVLLVKGRWRMSSWCFPRGRIEAGEEPHLCAMREVQEEIGFDCSKLLDKNSFLEVVHKGQPQRLYVIPGVPQNTSFVLRNRQEISEVRWFDIESLPLSEEDLAPTVAFGLPSIAFSWIIPFVEKIQLLVRTLQRSGVETSRARSNTLTCRVRPKSFANVDGPLKQLRLPETLKLLKPSGGIQLRPQRSWSFGK